MTVIATEPCILAAKNPPHHSFKVIHTFDVKSSDHVFTLLVDNSRVGYLCYTQPVWILKTFILHSLWIDPNHRQKGYATVLVQNVLKRLLQMNAQTIYVQPGPFEIEKGILQQETVSSYQTRIEELISLYKHWAKPLDEYQLSHPNKAKELFLRLLYRFLAIPENPRYLMIFSKKSSSVRQHTK